MKKMTQDEVIARAKLHHGDFYDYSSINYINQSRKIDVICPIHGVFSKWPKDFINGSGCKKCGDAAAAKKRADTTETFIKKAQNTHGNLYSYNEVNYTNNHTKVKIHCALHGAFWQEPWVHISGHHCPYCTGNRIKPIDQWITKFVAQHGTTYDYSLCEINANYPKITIICPEHGEFEQRIHDHANGAGCPRCATSGFSVDKPATLYYLSINNGEMFKIGVTNRTVEARFSLKELQSIQVVFTIDDDGDKILNCEQTLLKKHLNYKYNGPKLLNTGNTELFTCDIFNGNYPTTLKDINDT